MEATTEQESTGLLDKILPPRQEDAGVEVCALPPDSIHEAFLKAASAVKSRGATFYSDDEDEDDPFPDAFVVGGGSADSISDAVDSRVKEKGREKEVEKGKDVVIVGGDGVEAMAGKGCLEDELKDLNIKDQIQEKKKSENQDGI